MNIYQLLNRSAVEEEAAHFIALHAKKALVEKGFFTFALSKVSQEFLLALAEEKVDWSRCSLFQVDERIAPYQDPERNFTLMEKILKQHPPELSLFPMPVEATDLVKASQEYALLIKEKTQGSGILDLIHLGLGDDGHTASLVPHDPVLELREKEIALTELYRGFRRMTFTYPLINRAQHRLWTTSGSIKAIPVRELLEKASSIPAGLVYQEETTLFIFIGILFSEEFSFSDFFFD